jgi:hypothetical protein
MLKVEYLLKISHMRACICLQVVHFFLLVLNYKLEFA